MHLSLALRHDSKSTVWVMIANVTTKLSIKFLFAGILKQYQVKSELLYLTANASARMVFSEFRQRRHNFDENFSIRLIAVYS